MRLRATRVCGVIAAFFVAAAFLAPGTQGEDAPEALRIAASVVVPLSDVSALTITIEADGTTRIVQTGHAAGEEPLVVAFRLTPQEVAQARDAVAAARFFETWGPQRLMTDQATWHVTARLGDRELERDGIYAQPEFEPLERYLFRFVQQARITAGLRRGAFGLARTALRHHRGPGIAHPAALVEELVACAAGLEEPRQCGEAAALLFTLPDAGDAVRGAEALLPQLEGDRRGRVLAAWATELRSDDRADPRAAFTPLALQETAATWPRWPAMSPWERSGFGAILAMLLRDGTPQAFDVAESMARALSEPGAPVVPDGLLATGEAAVPIVLRLLGAPEPGARASGAKMAYRQASIVRKKTGLGEPLSEDALAALERRFGEAIVPALERRAEDASESFAVRTTCLSALDLWDGRVTAARARASEAAAAAAAERKRLALERTRAATPPPPPAGTLAIGGLLLGPFDVPLPGFGLYAVLPHDRRIAGHAVTGEDGAFRIDGLADGGYDLVCTDPGEGTRRLRSSAPPTAAGVAAGSTDLVLRLPGSLVRGRLLDGDGAPVVGARIIGRMRDEPSHQGPTFGSGAATTDARGRFWLLHLMPGVYDLQIPGWLALRGAAGIEAGPEERTVQRLAGASIAGRVLDESGAPLAGVPVSLLEVDRQGEVLQLAMTAPDGTFRLLHLAPAHRYTVGATLGAPAQRHAVARDIASGTEDLVLEIDTTPRLRFAVDFGARGNAGWGLRVERIGDGQRFVREFRDNPVSWPAAPGGTWRVFAHVLDVDGGGVPTDSWVEIGTVTTGEPEKTLVVPR